MSDNAIAERVEAEIQKRLNDPAYLHTAILHLTEAILDKDKALEIKEAELKSLVPVREFYERVTETEDWREIGAAAKLLAYKGYGQKKTFELLRDKGILRRNNEPYSEYVERGYFKTVEEIFDDSFGRTRIYIKTVVSQKGIEFIRKIIEEAVA